MVIKTSFVNKQEMYKTSVKLFSDSEVTSLESDIRSGLIRRGGKYGLDLSSMLISSDSDESVVYHSPLVCVEG